jgi:carbamoyltransferase
MERDIILGISAYYHDSAATLIINGEIIAAAQEERFSRIKNDASFPKHAIEFILSEAGITASQLRKIAFYDKPFVKFERLLETYHAFAPKGLKSFITAIPSWISEKIFFKKLLRKELKNLGFDQFQLYFPEHHLSHSASAFFPSPFEQAAILTIDGVGEWATTTIGIGTGNKIQILKELHFPHSLGLFYSAFTAYCGFKVNSGEYKLMGLSPYGNVNSDNYQKFKQNIIDKLIDIREDGSFLLNMEYFEFATGLKMYNQKKWEQLFGFGPLKLDSTLEQVHADLALAAQHVVEDVVFKLVRTTRELTNQENIVLAGGVALNSVANGKLKIKKIFKHQWIQPAAGDAGGSLGAALAVYYIGDEHERIVQYPDSMKNASLGPSFMSYQIEAVLKKYGAVFHNYSDNKEKFFENVANLLKQGNVVGWFQGRMEFGPRALGYRSILANPMNEKMQQKLNLKIKKRESFRPFAPIVLAEDVCNYFEQEDETPYMLHVMPVKKEILGEIPGGFASWAMKDKLKYSKGLFPAVTHVDGSARVQTISNNRNKKLYELLLAFKKITGSAVLVNTSFNERGEPIVCTPDDAFKSFMRTEMDILAIGNYVLYKKEQVIQLEQFEESFKLD